MQSLPADSAKAPIQKLNSQRHRMGIFSYGGIVLIAVKSSVHYNKKRTKTNENPYH